MRGGGGRGGGGRGGRGGRWFGKPSVTHDLIRDNLEDLGLDQYAAVDDKRTPELYPATKLPGIPTLFEEDVTVTHKSMYLLHRFRASKDYLGTLTDKDKKGPDFEYAEWSSYLPHELFTQPQQTKAFKKRANKKDLLNLQQLEAAESSGVNPALRRETSLLADDDAEDEKVEDEDNEAEAEEEMDYEEDDDYMADHYASDNDMGDDGGGGDEAVF